MQNKIDFTKCKVVPTKAFGGAYVSVTVNIKDVDLVNRLFITTDKQKIPMDDVLSIESEVFNENGE